MNFHNTYLAAKLRSTILRRILPALLFLTFYLYILDTIFPISLSSSINQFTKVITAEDGTPLRSFANKNGIWIYPINLEQASPLYLEALLNYEDRWFWYHPGINPISLIRALIQNVDNNKIVSGGSTLTMQVARLLSPHPRTIKGKVQQIFRALQLEWHYDKNQILTYYINNAPFGGTLLGIQAASYTYLGKSAKELSHAEAALLAVLPQAPSRNRPDRHPQRALLARNKVLHRLSKRSIWTQSIIDQSTLEPLISQHNFQPSVAPLISRRLKNKTANINPLKTTINYDMQMAIETLVKQYTEQFPKHTSTAVLIVENKTLKVKTYIGSANFLDSSRFGHIDMVKAIRSPGSTLKPFLYGIAIDKGLIHSKSLLIDAPTSFNGYKPQNFSHGFSGAVSVSQALTRSLNIPATQVLHALTAEVFVNLLKNAGLKLQLAQHAKPNLSVVLGGVGSNLETLVGTYTALANNGLSGTVRFLPDTPFIQRHLLSPGSAWIIKNILSNDSALGANGISWKTGTSYGNRDFWSIGVTPTYTVGVWIGRPDGTPLPGHFSSNTATPLLFAINNNLRHTESLKKPNSVSKTTICWPLGAMENKTAKALCHEKKQAWLVNNNAPLTLSNSISSNWQMNPFTLQINKSTGLIINNTCKVSSISEKKIALWPLSVEPWIANKYKRSIQIGKFDPSCKNQTIQALTGFKIKAIENNTKLHSAGGSAPLPRIKLNTQGGQEKIYWYINARLFYTSSINKPIYHQFQIKGKYQITAIDSTGNSDSINIEVI